MRIRMLQQQYCQLKVLKVRRSSLLPAHQQQVYLHWLWRHQQPLWSQCSQCCHLRCRLLLASSHDCRSWHVTKQWYFCTHYKTNKVSSSLESSAQLWQQSEIGMKAVFWWCGSGSGSRIPGSRFRSRKCDLDQGCASASHHDLSMCKVTTSHLFLSRAVLLHVKLSHANWVGVWMGEWLWITLFSSSDITGTTNDLKLIHICFEDQVVKVKGRCKVGCEKLLDRIPQEIQ